MKNDDLKFIEDFEWAEVRLATITIKGKDKRICRPVFSSIKLLPKGRSEPAPMHDVEHFPIKKNVETLHYRRIIMKAHEAINWYRNLESSPKTPTPTNKSDVIKGDGFPIIINKLIDDPIWPQLGLPIAGSLFTDQGNTHPSPFVGNTSARVHRRFGSQSGFKSLLDNNGAINFLTKRLHFNLKEYPEYLGSFTVIVLDPILKSVENFLVSNSGEEQIFYRFIPRSGQTLEGLKLSTFDQQSSLLTSFDTIDIPLNGIINIKKGSCTGKYGYVVTHPIHGILSYLPPAGFMRSLRMNMNIVSQTREVRVPIGESSNAAETRYTVHKVNSIKNSIIGDDHIPENVNLRVGKASTLRDNITKGKNADQQWFGKDSREQAMQFIRTRIGRAKYRVLIADPYFGVLQMPQFLLAVNSDAVDIEIFTSGLAFNHKSTQQQSPEGETCGVNTIETFNAQFQKIKSEVNLKVNVLPGKKPELHDRFLVVDDDVWFMGNSLNTLGDRASMIIKLPDPDSVLKELALIHKKSESFETYYNKTKVAGKK